MRMQGESYDLVSCSDEANSLSCLYISFPFLVETYGAKQAYLHTAATKTNNKPA